jgi:hypothetical protein
MAKKSAKKLPSRNDIKKLSEQLARVVSHPEFAKAVAEIQALSPDKRAAAFKDIASVDALSARGIDIPSTLRTSPRFFEDPSTRKVNPNDPGVAFWVRRDSPAIPLHPDTLIEPSTVETLLRPPSLSAADFGTLGGWSVCVSGGFGVCVSIGYQQ